MKICSAFVMCLLLVGCGSERPKVLITQWTPPEWVVSVQCDQPDRSDAPKESDILAEFNRVTACALEKAKPSGKRPSKLPKPAATVKVQVVISGELWTGQPAQPIGPYGVKLYAGSRKNGTNKPSSAILGEVGRWFAKRIGEEGCGR